MVEPASAKVVPQKEQVDYKLLNRLMEEKNTFQTSKQINRVGFSFIIGILFHYFYVAAQLNYCTLGTFIPLLLTFYFMMEQYEKRTYSNPISVSTYLIVLTPELDHAQKWRAEGRSKWAERF